MWIKGIILLWLIVLSIWDIRNRKVPVWILILALLLSVGCALTRMNGGGMEWRIVMSSIAPGIILLVVAGITGKVGWADGVVYLVLGLVCMDESSLIIFLVSLFLAAAGSVLLLALHKVNRNSQIPYIPFTTLAWILCVFGRW